MRGLLAVGVVLTSSGLAAAAAVPGCNASTPAPYNVDGGTPASTATAVLTVGFSGNGSGTVTIASDAVAADAGNGTATCATTCRERYPTTASVNLTATAASDSVFDGWDPATSDPSCPTVSMAANLTCTAIFQKLAETSEGGEDAGAAPDATFPDGGPGDAASEGG